MTATTVRRTWSYRQRDPVTFDLLFGGQRLAQIAWAESVRHEHRTMIRIVEGLNTRKEHPPRTWSIRWDDATVSARLFHNGHEMAEICWFTDLRVVNVPTKWLSLMVDGLNRDGGHNDPVPEPAAPPRLREVS